MVKGYRDCSPDMSVSVQLFLSIKVSSYAFQSCWPCHGLCAVVAAATRAQAEASHVVHAGFGAGWLQAGNVF